MKIGKRSATENDIIALRVLSNTSCSLSLFDVPDIPNLPFVPNIIAKKKMKMKNKKAAATSATDTNTKPTTRIIRGHRIAKAKSSIFLLYHNNFVNNAYEKTGLSRHAVVNQRMLLLPASTLKGSGAHKASGTEILFSTNPTLCRLPSDQI